MSRQRVSVSPISGALGAELGEVDLSRPMSDAIIGEIRAALLQHHVIFFRDQHLTPEQHLAFGRRFGELQVHDFVEGMADNEEILEVRKEAEETRNFGGGWHTDVSYLERPALGSVLYALEVPEWRRHAVRQPAPGVPDAVGRHEGDARRPDRGPQRAAALRPQRRAGA